MTRLSIDISDELHHYLKIHTARTKKNIKDFVTEAIYKKVDTEKVPNEETIRALEESAKGIGVTRFSSVEGMFNELYQELEGEGFKVEKHG